MPKTLHQESKAPHLPQFFTPLVLGLIAVSLTACGGGSSGDTSTGGSTVSVPGAPTLSSVAVGNASAALTFTAPSSTGGASISAYTATCVGTSQSASASGASSPITVSNLTNGQAYSCSVAATNSAGTGASSNSLSVTPSASVAQSGTSAVLCSLQGTGTQSLSYNLTDPTTNAATAVNDSLAYNYTWSCSGSTRTFSGNGVPNHAVTGGNFATRISTQSISGTVTTSPAAASTSTAVKLPGYALNSVKLDPATAGTCTNTATSVSSGCNYAGGTGAWRMEALNDPSVTPWRFDFGTDQNNAHTQPNGQYHYHGMPTHLITALNANSTNSMTLVAWAADGFPIYANLGYATATDATSALRAMKGSYRVKSSPDSNRPSVSDFAMGHFQQDWEYAAGTGDLDECNGRTGVTPEFPQGIYHYYITSTYPFVQRCVKGSAATWANQGP